MQNGPIRQRNPVCEITLKNNTETVKPRVSRYVKMRQVFSDDMELKFIEVWHKRLVDKQGTMTLQSEKVDKVVTVLNDYSKEIGHGLNAKQIKNKIDSMKKKAKSEYKAVRMKTTTGANVEDDHHLEVRIDLNAKINRRPITQPCIAKSRLRQRYSGGPSGARRPRSWARWLSREKASELEVQYNFIMTHPYLQIRFHFADSVL